MLQRPRTFTTNEEFIDTVRDSLLTCGHTYQHIADKSNVSRGTVQRIASGQTRWPRPTTLFPLLVVLNLQIQLVPVRSKRNDRIG